MDVVDGFGSEATGWAGGDAGGGSGDIVVLEPGEEGDQLGAGDGGEGGVLGDEEFEFVIAVFVALDGVIGFPGGGFVE